MLPVDVRPVCADPVWLPLIDAAFEVGGAAAAHTFTAQACSKCPVATACLGEALAGPEHGPWGGTTGRKRSELTGRSPIAGSNVARVHHAGRKLPSVGEVHALRAGGLPVVAIAERFSCSTAAVYHRLRQAA